MEERKAFNRSKQRGQSENKQRGKTGARAASALPCIFSAPSACSCGMPFLSCSVLAFFPASAAVGASRGRLAERHAQTDHGRFKDVPMRFGKIAAFAILCGTCHLVGVVLRGESISSTQAFTGEAFSICVSLVLLSSHSAGCCRPFSVRFCSRRRFLPINLRRRSRSRWIPRKWSGRPRFPRGSR